MNTKDSVVWARLSAALRRALLCAIALCAVLHGSTVLAQVGITGSLANFDVRYPVSLPNDLEVIIYGDGLTPAHVLGTFTNAQWGQANSITGGVNNDPTSPAFGLDCVIVRWVGPPQPGLVGQMMHFGVRLRLGAAVAHQEVWWTINGVRILRPCDPHITWICTTHGWLVCIANPTLVNMYVYGLRYFPVGPGPLPLLSQMNTNINPALFGAPGWTPVALPGNVRLLCIPPWCRIYIRVTVTRWRPIIFQVAARNVEEMVLPLQPPVGPIVAPDPNDFDGQDGTMNILTSRATEQFPEDLTNDGVVGIPDFNVLRPRIGTTTSGDFNQTQ